MVQDPSPKEGVSAKEIESLVSGSTFNAFDFTAVVRRLCWESRLCTASELIDLVVSNGLQAANGYRVKNARSIVKSVERHLSNIDRRLQSHPETYEKVALAEKPLPVVRGIPRRLDARTAQGQYVNHLANFPISDRSIDNYVNDESLLRILLDSGFGARGIPSFEADTVSVLKSVRFSSLSSDSLAAIGSDGSCAVKSSGRVAKASQINLLQETSHEIPEAFVLPFAHAPGNYYHSLLEMIYGFRHVIRVHQDCPIIYGDDRFQLVPTVATALGIDSSRLVHVSEVLDTAVESAYVPGVNPFVWSSNVASFFRHLARRICSTVMSSRPSIYISRARSSRSPVYEETVERWLRSVGFTIIYAEDLKFKEQVTLFSNASRVVAHHGAGLANIVFCPEDVRIIEIFSNDMTAPDFFERSRYITRDYVPVLGSPDSVISQLSFAL